jgi:phenylacetate-CoA ligase
MSDEDAITYEQILDMLMESQFWPPDVMRDFQRTQLEQLLRHARANVPFYETRLDCMFREDDSIDWQKWDEIPLLTRQDVQNHRKDMLARELPPGHGDWQDHSTSGSTARPITVRVPRLMATVNKAAWTRFFRSHGVPDDAKVVLVQSLAGAASTANQEFEVHFDKVANNRRFTMVSRDLATDRKLDVLSELQTEVLIDSPNALEILAHHNSKRNRPVEIKWIFGFGMGFTQEQLSLIQSSFNTRVISAYSSKEAGPIALQCPASLNYHVNEELVVVERQFAHAANIIVTPIFQSAQPLIRYVHNDVVRMVPSCSCGYQHLTITSIDGRSEPIFKMPNGIDFVPTMVDITKSDFHKICFAIQLAQTSATQFELRYMADRLASDDELEPVRAILHRQLGSNVHLRICKVDIIPANAGGKQQRFVREFDP